MNARKRKATRQADYYAGPLWPWRTKAYYANLDRMRLKRGTAKPIPMEIGWVDGFRFISALD